MAQYGIQPNGMIRLSDGTMWNPNDALPPESTGAFNSTPMGSPLNGLGTMAPTAVAPQPTQPAPQAASGMMFAGLPKADPAQALPTPQVNLPVSNMPAAKPGFRDPGGLSDKLGLLSDVFSGKDAFGSRIQQRDQFGQTLQADSLKQQMEYQRQLALARYKNANPDPGSVETNATYYERIGRKDLADQYRAQYAAGPPVVGTVNGVTGLIPRTAGVQAAPTTKTIGGTTYYNVNGDWYDNPEGK